MPLSTVIKASPVLEITDKQVGFINSLVTERPNWPDTAPGPISRTIKIAIRPVPDGTTRPFISRADGSKTIDWLLKLPKPTNTPAAHFATAAATNTDIKTVAMNAVADLPASHFGVKYAIKPVDEKAANDYIFYELREYKGKKYLNRLQGAPGSWVRKFVKYADYAKIAERILEVGPKAAAHKYSELYTRCCCCDAELSNTKSIEQAMGPVCAKKFM